MLFQLSILSNNKPDGVVTHLGVFAKYWEAGAVKTRLARTIGFAAAAELHRSFVATTLRRFRHVGASRSVWMWPPECAESFSETVAELVSDSWRVRLQSAGDLGWRMREYFAATLPHSGRAVLIGSDSPDLPAERIDEAFSALGTHDVVLVPSRDGGYCLVGMSSWIPQIFDNMAWSTPGVLATTLSRLDSAGARYVLLNDWEDIDDVADLARLKARLAAAPPNPLDPSLNELHHLLNESSLPLDTPD